MSVRNRLRSLGYMGLWKRAFEERVQREDVISWRSAALPLVKVSHRLSSSGPMGWVADAESSQTGRKAGPIDSCTDIIT
jgi:hypothetical protein